MLEKGNWKAYFAGALSTPVLKFACTRCHLSASGAYDAKQLAEALKIPPQIFHCGEPDPCPIELLQHLSENQKPEPLPPGPSKGDTNQWTAGAVARHIGQLTGAAQRPPAKILVPLFPDELPTVRVIDTWTAQRDRE